MTVMRDKATVPVEVTVVADGRADALPDQLATEEPLEIRLGSKRPAATTRSLTVTMRTPGEDRELALGFLFAEGAIRGMDDVAGVRQLEDNVVAVTLALKDEGDGGGPDWTALERRFFTTSACGLCGKASIEQLLLGRSYELASGPRIEAENLASLPASLRQGQGLFQSTGGLHAAALFTAGGELVALREDIGRHNAVDKLVGWALEEERLPLSGHVLLLSGRASFELVGKALAAGIPIVASVSAPSSAAVASARRFGMTLVGFLRDGRFNIYSGVERLVLPKADGATIGSSGGQASS
ncbi:MAG TPA: formate dehydrogenase accessory sulfurtransferase FdhD [Thermoanaerobaculia bacterium]|nr:formate dehydrogenase accessory sulfurtransferase FdhD [Thermoanaerobaculia bacterium]